MPEQIVKTETVEVPVPVYVPLPEDLIKDCPVPAFPDPYTVGAAMDYEAALISSLENCNEDKAAIRDLQPVEEVSIEELIRSAIP